MNTYQISTLTCLNHWQQKSRKICIEVLELTQQNMDKLQSPCDHLGNHWYSMYHLGTQNCLTASCQCMQSPICYFSDEGQKMGRNDREWMKGFPSFVFSPCCPFIVVLTTEKAAAPSSFRSSTTLGNSALCFQGWLETILSFFYI